MAVTLKDVEYVAQLARLQFTPEEMEKFTHHLNEILQYVEKLNELDTEHVEPLSHVIELANVFRDDVVKLSLPREELLMNSPAHNDEFFQVPKIIGDQGKKR